MRLVIVEGLDGVGKTTAIHKVINHLYEKHNLKSFTASPLDLSPEIKALVTSSYPCFVKYYLLLDSCQKLICQLKKEYASFDFVFLDRLYYSSFAYSLYDIPQKDWVVPLYFLEKFEKGYRIPAYYLRISESLRKQYLLQKKETKLWDSADDFVTQKIKNAYNYLLLRTSLQETTDFVQSFLEDLSR